MLRVNYFYALHHVFVPPSTQDNRVNFPIHSLNSLVVIEYFWYDRALVPIQSGYHCHQWETFHCLWDEWTWRCSPPHRDVSHPVWIGPPAVSSIPPPCEYHPPIIQCDSMVVHAPWDFCWYREESSNRFQYMLLRRYLLIERYLRRHFHFPFLYFVHSVVDRK